MVLAGYSPSVRLFEAAACGATIISDNWPGLETLFKPGKQILVPATGDDVLAFLREMSDAEIRRIGDAAQAHVLEHHTNAHRALEFEDAVERARKGTTEQRSSELSAEKTLVA